MADGGGWNDPARVERFAARDADRRLVRLLDRYPDPGRVRVLDLGCAGGRNAALLAERGFDVYALDLAPAMVARTRDRVAVTLGAAEARRRVVTGDMRDLRALPVETFDLVVALGVYHQAEDEASWRRALEETARVLPPPGLCLVAVFVPGTGPVGAPLRSVPGTRFVHEGFESGRLCLRDPRGLDADFLSLGFVPELPTEVVEREEEGRLRVTANATYRRREAGGTLPRDLAGV